jgi:hypothetical protein
MWQRTNYDKALSVVRKCKISWSSVLFRAAPTETIKAKRNRPEQKVVRSPPKPSRSPWLSPSERSELGNLFKEQWSFLEGYRKRFVALTPEQQHKSFASCIRSIKAEYEKLNSISNSLHARLGKRKYWIERVCRQDNFKPKPKKGEAESFILSAHFFKKDLTRLALPVKKVFSPLTYLDEEPYKSMTIWSNVLDSDKPFTVTASCFSLDEDGEAYRLWQIWAELFVPVIPQDTIKVDDPSPISDYNIYTQLPEETPA